MIIRRYAGVVQTLSLTIMADKMASSESVEKLFSLTPFLNGTIEKNQQRCESNGT